MLARVLLLAALSLLTACGTLRSPPATSSGVSSARFCDQPEAYSANQQSRLFQFAEQVRHELSAGNTDAAIVSRTGVDLQRLGIRFTHSGIALRTTGDIGWNIRQLYYACDEARPRLYDQGIGGFLFGSDNPDVRHVSIIFLPAEPAARLRSASRDNHLALQLLGARYSANAYPFSVLYQNCNQWVIEMLATAWGRLPNTDRLRTDAQAWLQRNQYRPRPIELTSHWVKFMAALSPMVQLDDHPEPERDGLKFEVSLPRTIETFIRHKETHARRIELCHNKHAIVVSHGWNRIKPGCHPQAGDRIIPFT